MPPKAKEAKGAKDKRLSPEEQSAREGELKRVLDGLAKSKAPMDAVAPFVKRVKTELEAIKNGEQFEIPQIPLFVYPLPNVEKMDFQVCRSLLTVLESYQWLRRIQLYHCAIGDDGAMLVAEFLKVYKPSAAQNPFGIEILELPECGIGPRGAGYLGRVLTQNETVKVLNLDFNPLGDEGAANLGDGLKWNSTVEKLSLKYCNIGQLGGEAVGKFIVRSSSVKELYLRGNPLEAHGVTHIARSLAKNAYLVKLDLADTSFGIDLEAVEALRDGIESNDSLESVDLNLNSIVPAGVQLLLEMLRPKTKLTQFDIYERISDVVFRDVLDVVAQHQKEMKRKNKGKGRGGSAKKKAA